MTYDEIVDEVASETSLSPKLVNRVYKAYWRAVREYVVSLPLKQELSDAEFMSTRPNINIPSIGKLYVTLDKYHRMKKLQEIIKSNNNN